MAFIKGKDRNQAQMFPEYLEDYVDEESPVRVIEAFVEVIDIKKYNFTKSNTDRVGAPSYDPKDLIKLYIYTANELFRQGTWLQKSVKNVTKKTT